MLIVGACFKLSVFKSHTIERVNLINLENTHKKKPAELSIPTKMAQIQRLN